MAIVTASLPPVLREGNGRFRKGTGPPQRRGRGAPDGNLNAAKHPWRSYWKRRALRKEDRWIAPLVQAYSDGLCSDKGGKDNMSYAETAMAELASLARGCVLLVLAAAARGGGIAGARRGTTLTGPGQARTITDPDLAATLARFMAVEAGALKTLGLGRRSKPALSLAEYIEGKAQRTETPS